MEILKSKGILYIMIKKVFLFLSNLLYFIVKVKLKIIKNIHLLIPEQNICLEIKIVIIDFLLKKL